MSKPVIIRSTILIVVMASAMMATAADPATRGFSSADITADKPAGTAVPLPPDPDVIRQGGDTCAAAYPITALPFTDTGTTVGYTDDYDEVCPFTGSTSPDVVYSFTPTTDISVFITLCTGNTDYDTKLYIYESTCPNSPPFACNDDSCISPLYVSGAYVSLLMDVALTAGQTYYIVVDGYGGESGNFSIDVFEQLPPDEPLPCLDVDTLYSQGVHNRTSLWGIWTSGEPSWADYTVFENFPSDLFSITDFHWWGLSGRYDSAWYHCDPAGMTFDLLFFDDVDGQPGAEVCAFTGLTPTMTDTGLLYAGFPLYYWEATNLTPACETGRASWVSVKSLANTNDCGLLWTTSPIGDGMSLQLDASTGETSTLNNDMSMCVTGELVPVELLTFEVD